MTCLGVSGSALIRQLPQSELMNRECMVPVVSCNMLSMLSRMHLLEHLVDRHDMNVLADRPGLGMGQVRVPALD